MLRDLSAPRLGIFRCCVYLQDFDFYEALVWCIEHLNQCSVIKLGEWVTSEAILEEILLPTYYNHHSHLSQARYFDFKDEGDKTLFYLKFM